MPQHNDTKICLGIITTAHGIRGDVKIKSFMEDPARIADYTPLANEDGSRKFIILSLYTAGKSLVARLEGITSRNEAEKLRGTKLFTTRDQLPELEEEDGEWYYSDLIGLDVIKVEAPQKQRKKIGTIKSIQNFGAGDLVEIEFPGSQTSDFFDFNEATFPVVDVNGGYVEYIAPDYEDAGDKRDKKKRQKKPASPAHKSVSPASKKEE